MTQEEYNLIITCEYLEDYRNLSEEEKAEYTDFLDFMEQKYNIEEEDKNNRRE